MQVGNSPKLQIFSAVVVHQVGLEFRDFVEHGLASEIAEEHLVVVLGVLLLRLERVGSAIPFFVVGQLLFARVEMAAIIALESVVSQCKVELQPLGLLVQTHTPLHELGVGIVDKEQIGLAPGEPDLLRRHNLFNY